MRTFAPQLLAPIVLTLLTAAPPLRGQTAPLVSGRVLDTDGQPLSGVDVEVLGSLWNAVSGRDGRFRLRLPAGTWSLRIARIGYRPDTLDVTLRVGAEPVAVEARLTAAPIQLRGLSVEEPRAPPLSRTVTTETVRQVPPLGEPDIFRAVVLLPGVAQPNDLKGRIHLAGGASDETGVRLDGHPLQDPFHLLGLFGAFNVAALERADVLIHHLPPRLGGRLSGEVDLESRRADDEAEYEAVVSLLSSGITAVLPDGPASVDVLASGRITYLDRVGPLISSDIPEFGFRDALVRLGRSWGNAWRTELLAFNTRDRFRDRDRDAFRDYEPLRWGESLLGARVRRDRAAWSLAARASFNRASVHLDERVAGGSNYVDSRRDWTSAAVSIARTGRWWRVDAGAGFDHRSNRQAWIARGLADELFSPNTPEEYEDARSWSATSAFGEAQVKLGGRWMATAGARIWSAERLRIAPRAHLSFRAGDALELSAAYDRRYQFDAQLEEPIEGSVSPPLFLIHAPREADVLAAAARLRPRRLPLGATAAFDVQAFWKEYRHRTLLSELAIDQTRRAVGDEFPRFDRIGGSSTGVAVGGRVELGNGLLVQGSYIWQRVREVIDGRAYPTSWDAPHTFNLFASVPLWRRWTFNVVFQTHSGRATTPVRARIYEPDAGGAWNRIHARYLRGERHSLRIPPYRRLDLGLRREGRLWGADFTLAIQVLNILARANPIDYDWRQYFSNLQDTGRQLPGRNGLPIVPSIGVEARW